MFVLIKCEFPHLAIALVNVEFDVELRLFDSLQAIVCVLLIFFVGWFGFFYYSDFTFVTMKL